MDLKINHQKKKYIIIGNLIIFITIILFTLYYYQNIKKKHIYEYDESRDKKAILDIFDKNWYWLVDENVVGFSPEHMLDTKSSSNNEKDKGNLNIKVFVEDNITKGFITYYTEINKKNKLKNGVIFILGVDEKYRNKGIAKELLKYAINDLKNRLKCDSIYLYTRSVNNPAIKCYLDLGFKPKYGGIGYIKFEYKQKLNV